jgi:hypothetical protein
MGARQSKPSSPPDFFVVMIKGDLEVCAMGVFSTLDAAINQAGLMGTGRKIWIEKFRLDDSSYYEDQDEYIVWQN